MNKEKIKRYFTIGEKSFFRVARYNMSTTLWLIEDINIEKQRKSETLRVSENSKKKKNYPFEKCSFISMEDRS